jgi:hypothetical protein
MKKGCLIVAVILGVIAILFIYGFLTPFFQPEHDRVEIKQNIGGTLICNFVDNGSLISYQYRLPKNTTINIGDGSYYKREWKKDEQLIQYSNWTILKTGERIRCDKLIIGDLKTQKWTEYTFSPDNIEKDSIWRKSRTHSLLNYCCSEAYVDKIDNGQIVLHYKFRTSEKQGDEYGQRTIYYSIDNSTGQPTMTKVE